VWSAAELLAEAVPNRVDLDGVTVLRLEERERAALLRLRLRHLAAHYLEVASHGVVGDLLYAPDLLIRQLTGEAEVEAQPLDGDVGA